MNEVARERSSSRNYRSDANILRAHAAAQFSDLSKKAIDEGKRGVLDWLGCALAGSRHPTLDRLLLVLQECGGKPQATVFGRGLKLGFLDAPIANGQVSHGIKSGVR